MYLTSLSSGVPPTKNLRSLVVLSGPSGLQVLREWVWHPVVLGRVRYPYPSSLTRSQLSTLRTCRGPVLVYTGLVLVQFEGINNWVSNMFNMGQYVHWLLRRLPYPSATRTQVRQRISKADTVGLQYVTWTVVRHKLKCDKKLHNKHYIYNSL